MNKTLIMGAIAFVIIIGFMQYTASHSKVRLTNCVMEKDLEYFDKIGVKIDRKTQVCGNLKEENMSTIP